MRILAQYVRLDGQIHRLAVLEIPVDGGRPHLIPSDGATHSTTFFNGILLLAPPDYPLPQCIRATDALTLLTTIPEPADSFIIAKVPFNK